MGLGSGACATTEMDLRRGFWSAAGKLRRPCATELQMWNKFVDIRLILKKISISNKDIP